MPTLPGTVLATEKSTVEGILAFFVLMELVGDQEDKKIGKC